MERIEQAADALIQLINSQSRTPTKDQIVGVLAPHMPCDLRATYAASDWARLFHAYLDAQRAGSSEERQLHNKKFDAEVATIWSSPARTPLDVLVRVAIAVNWNSTPRGTPSYPRNVINDPKAPMYEKALAQVVQGVLDVAGVKFDGEGRLLG